MISVIEKEAEINTVSQFWLASNLPPKDFREVLTDMEASAGIIYSKKADTSHIQDEWRRLASFAASLK